MAAPHQEHGFKKEHAGGASSIDEIAGPYLVDFAMILLSGGLKLSWVKAIIASLTPTQVKAAVALPAIGGWLASRLPGELLHTTIIPNILKQVIGEVSRVLRDHIQKHGGKKGAGINMHHDEQVAKAIDALPDGKVAEAVTKAVGTVLNKKQFWISNEGILHITECPKLMAQRIKPKNEELISAFTAYKALAGGHCASMKCCDHAVEREFTQPVEAAPKAVETKHGEHAHDDHGHHGHGEAAKDGPHNGWLSFTTPKEQEIIFAWLCGITSTTKRMKQIDFLAKHLDKHEVPSLIAAIQSNNEERLATVLRTIENTNLGAVAEKKFQEAKGGTQDLLGDINVRATDFRKKVEGKQQQLANRAADVGLVEALTGHREPKRSFGQTVVRVLLAPFNF